MGLLSDRFDIKLPVVTNKSQPYGFNVRQRHEYAYIVGPEIESIYTSLYPANDELDFDQVQLHNGYHWCLSNDLLMRMPSIKTNQHCTPACFSVFQKCNAIRFTTQQ
jgi:hypothetical protein